MLSLPKSTRAVAMSDVSTVPLICSIMASEINRLRRSIQRNTVCGFGTVAVVCDGASSNMTMVKEISGSKRGAYENVLICLCTMFFSFLGGSESTQPSFLSLYTGKLVHFIICPSHQVCIISVWSPPNTRTCTVSTVEKDGIRTVSVKITGKKKNEIFSDWVK